MTNNKTILAGDNRCSRYEPPTARAAALIGTPTINRAVAERFRKMQPVLEGPPAPLSSPCKSTYFGLADARGKTTPRGAREGKEDRQGGGGGGGGPGIQGGGYPDFGSAERSEVG